ncbi:erythrocyte membrane protein 1, EMP1 [Plasmodium reichenowi]|uniref:Erythrocyte membrane protein 1, EMP1 n=1 Tax=Plasmodium reichenowi TaxID=5854 RepID=A0A060RQN5_PLARE|nr:erythrocyte membrane protein 1, EMP1 [Plasmodium reichenowi]
MVKIINPQDELSGIEDENAKHALDKLGEKIYEKAKRDARPYFNALHGNLSEARFESAPKEKQATGNPCELLFRYHTNATNGYSYPCRTGRENRFSEVKGGECDNNKVRGNNGKESGACAPYRRVNLCVRNLQNISAFDKISNDTLLADVLLAALHEGDTIRGAHGKYQETNSDVSSNICTMLARSFADIGDIIRGKDLYRGDNGNDKLENNMKKIFAKIYGKLTDRKIKDRYKNDGPDFYQLREDWWYANRLQVWYAITCDAGGGTYFRNTCGTGEKRTPTKGNCRCVTHNVPTYFDYVPQYLRWFEEWAEEFCRLRKHKLQNAIKNCRTAENGESKYCDLNGYDCTQTIKGKNQRVEGEGCKKCILTCHDFVHWIENQKEEFEKQRNKYHNEIGKAKNTMQISNGNINTIYEKEFYGHLKEDYEDVKNFLDKLNKEKICEKQQHDDGKISNISFSKEEETFSHTEYCRACPWCGLQKGANDKWERIEDMNACAKDRVRTITKEKTTDIKILTPEKTQKSVLKKYEEFCTKGNNEIKNWECYYEKKDEGDEGGDNNICVLQNDNVGKAEEKSMHYNSFFWKWVAEMLIDSMYWRNEVGKCKNKAKKGKCKNKQCEESCKCYEKWVRQKNKEWEDMVTHFKKQEGFGLFLNNYDYALNTLLNVDDIVTNIKGGYEDTKEIDDIKKILDEEKRKNEEEQQSTATDGVNSNEQKTTIDLLIKHETQEAKECQQKQKECEDGNNKTQEFGRSERPDKDDVMTPVVDNQDDHHDDDHDNHTEIQDLKIQNLEDEVPDFKDVEEATSGDTTVETKETTTTDTEPKVDVCETVKTALENTKNLTQACSQKYSTPNRYWGWKCVSSDKTATGESGAECEAKRKRREAPRDTTPSSSDKGAICIPPRRRKMYISPLSRWAEKYNKGKSLGEKASLQNRDGDSSESSVSGSSGEGSGGSDGETTGVSRDSEAQTSPQPSVKNPEEELLKAFVESAAVETFFLWDRYKKEWEQRKNKSQQDVLGLGGAYSTGPLPYSPGPSTGEGPSTSSTRNGLIFESLPTGPRTGERGPALPRLGGGLTGEEGLRGPMGPRGERGQELGLLGSRAPGLQHGQEAQDLRDTTPFGPPYASTPSWATGATGSHSLSSSSDEGPSEAGSWDHKLKPGGAQLPSPNHPSLSSQQTLNSLTPGSSTSSDDPQATLARGKIPPDPAAAMKDHQKLAPGTTNSNPVEHNYHHPTTHHYHHNKPSTASPPVPQLVVMTPKPPSLVVKSPPIF